jgi:thioredoxin-related protein
MMIGPKTSRGGANRMLTARRLAVTAFAFLVVLGLATSGRAVGEAEPALADNGLHTQPWFLESFLELSDDLAEAAAEGKHFAIVWEQRGCPYCREMHRVNFADARIKSFVTSNFVVLQLDLWGSRKVTDFDGEELEERHLARKWGVNFTPSIVFFPDDPEAVKGKDGKAAEVFRMPGYFKPFHFYSMFEYVRGRKYQVMGFQKFLQTKLAELEAKGISPDVW